MIDEGQMIQCGLRDRKTWKELQTTELTPLNWVIHNQKDNQEIKKKKDNYDNFWKYMGEQYLA